jgi:hypothetical protein
MRAPRMRWTTTLHARFVHAVELLGGHESMLHLQFPFLNKKMNFILFFWLLFHNPLLILAYTLFLKLSLTRKFNKTKKKKG